MKGSALPSGVSTAAAAEARVAAAGSKAEAKVIAIQEGELIRARKAAQAAEVPEALEHDLASGDRVRGSLKGKGTRPPRGGTDEIVSPRRQVSESSGSGRTNIPPEEPPIGVEPAQRGDAIERAHLDSMAEFNRPKAKDFSGLDAWKNGKDLPRRTLPNGQKVRTVTDADVLQVKSVGRANMRSGLDQYPPLSTIESRVQEGIKGLDVDVFSSRTDKSLRIINPRTRTLDVVFDESALLDVAPEVRGLMRDLASDAGAKGIEIRWFRILNSQKSRIHIK
jgi:hypothetical protein